jgi:hypothetical protein
MMCVSIIFRLGMRVKVFPNDPVRQLYIADVGSCLINSVSIFLMNHVRNHSAFLEPAFAVQFNSNNVQFFFKIYNLLAKKLTKWECHKTKEAYKSSLIYKQFAFQFVNSYASFFYLTYFRDVLKKTRFIFSSIFVS